MCALEGRALGLGTGALTRAAWRGVLQGVFPQLLLAGGSSPAVGRWQVARASAEQAVG